MTALADIAELGAGAPFLGPWFLADGLVEQAVTIAAPEAGTLGCPLRLPDGMQDLRWLPPTIGALGYAVSGPDAPVDILALRNAEGVALFATPGLALGHFRIERRVQSRLEVLMNRLGETGPRPVSLTLAFPGDADDIAAMVRPQGDSATLEALGLAGSKGLVHDFKIPHRLLDTAGINDTVAAILDALRERLSIKIGDAPKVTSPETAQTLLNLPGRSANQAILYAHDAQGLAIDPGYVAALFARLLDAHPELAPPALALTATPAICPVEDWRGIHFCGFAGGALPEDTFARVIVETEKDGQRTGRPAEVVLGALEPDAALRLAAGTRPLRLAQVPKGRFRDNGAESLQTLFTFWDGMDAPDRDQVRVMVVDHEFLLTGQDRSDAPTGIQDFDSARIAVAPGRVGLGVTGFAAGASLVACLSQGEGTVATPWLEPSVGGPPASLGSFQEADLPEGFNLQALREGLTIEAAHLRGTGVLRDGAVQNAAALVTLRLTVLEGGDLPADLQLRPLLHVLDRQSGRLVRRMCGPARLRTDPSGTGHVAHLLIKELPTLSQDAEDPQIGFDLLFPTARGPRTLADLRVARPEFVDGAHVTIAAPEDTVVAVETGRMGPGLMQNAGETLVLLRADGPVLLMPDAQTAYGPETVGVVLNSAHSVALLPPDGRLVQGPSLAPLTGAAVQTHADDGGGVLGRHRGTLAVCDATACLGGAPGDPGLMQVSSPADPFGQDAGEDVAGVLSALIEGPAAEPMRQALRAIQVPDTFDLVADAPLPTTPAPLAADDVNAAQVAILRSVGRGGEGPQAGVVLPKIDTLGIIDALDTWLDTQEANTEPEVQTAIRALRTAIDGQAHRARAAHRRILAMTGLTEMRDAVLAAIGRAEHHVVIFAEALDLEPDAGLAVISALSARLAARPALEVIIVAGDTAVAIDKTHFDPDDKDVSLEAWQNRLGSNRVHGVKIRAPGRVQVRQYGSLVAVDGLAAWMWPGGLTRWGLLRNGSVGIGILGDVVEGGSSPLVVGTVRAGLAWHLGIPLPDLAETIPDIARLLGQRSA